MLTATRVASRFPLKALTVGLALIGWTPGAATAGYTVTDVGSFETPIENGGPGPYDTYGYGLNNHGAVVGSSRTYMFSPEAFLWDGTNFRNVDAYGGMFSFGATATAVNDLGQAAGFRLTRNTRQPIATAGYSQLPTGYNSASNDINNHGVAVGFYEHFNPFGSSQQPFIATPPKDPSHEDYSISPILNGSGQPFDGTATAINDAGQVVGAVETAGGNFTAFLWTPPASGTGPGTFLDFSSSMPEGSYATSINNSGVIAGLRGGAGFIYDDGVVTDLPFYAASINASGQVVGDTFLYSNGVTTDLSDLDLGQGHGPTQLMAINDSGQILAQGFETFDGTVYTRAFLLTPDAAVPEPAGLTLMALGGIGLLVAARGSRRANA